MKKKLLSILLATLMLVSIAIPAQALAPARLWIHGSYVSTDVDPILENNRTLVPLRVISETLGYEVTWDGTARQVSIKDDSKAMLFTIGQATYTLDGKATSIDVAPTIRQNRTFVPVRAIAEAFDQAIDWDNANRIVVIGEGYKAPSSNTFKEVYVTRVVDGDTIEVNLDGKKEKVRLILVDTPETVHPNKPVEFYGKEASNFTKSKLEGKSVYLEYDVQQRDRYGRVLAYVWTERPASNSPSLHELKTKCFNASLLIGGYASVATYPPNIRYVDQFRAMEKEAREASRGLWAGGTAPQAKPQPKPGPSQSTPIAGEYVGNVNSSIFHISSCKSVKKMNPANAVGFSTRSEATSKGYRPCKVCKP